MPKQPPTPDTTVSETGRPISLKGIVSMKAWRRIRKAYRKKRRVQRNH